MLLDFLFFHELGGTSETPASMPPPSNFVNGETPASMPPPSNFVNDGGITHEYEIMISILPYFLAVGDVFHELLETL